MDTENIEKVEHVQWYSIKIAASAVPKPSDSKTE